MSLFKKLLLGLIALSLYGTVNAQNVISGKVISEESKSPLPGVTIMVKGTQEGTVSGATGNYSINAPSGNDTLVFSYLGYKTQEIPINKRGNININMKGTASGLNEVVVVGYGKQTKGSLTGAISTISGKVFQSRPITNTLSALQGEIPGVTVTRTSGQPGREGYTFNIRGISSINGNAPLVLIDGIPGDLSNLDPEDIASITVLKDASASIYGSRAADGVLLVTTRKGKAGSLIVKYSGNVAIKEPTYIPKKATVYQTYKMFNEAAINDGQPAPFTDLTLQKTLENYPTPNPQGEMWYLTGYPLFYKEVNWNKILYGNAIQQQHNLSVSGGSKKMTYYFSGGYFNTNGNVKIAQDQEKRYNLRSDFHFILSDKLTLDAKIAYENDYIIEPSMIGNAMLEGIRMFSFQPEFTPKGNYYEYQAYMNPVQELAMGGIRHSDDEKLLTNFKGDYQILPSLKLTGQVGINTEMLYDNTYYRTLQGYNWDETPDDYVVNSPNNAWYTNSNDLYKNYTFYIDYNKDFFVNHHLNLMAGTSTEEYNYQSHQVEGSNFPGNEIFTLNLANQSSATNTQITGSEYSWALNSYFGRLGYNYKGKYLINFTARLDGSSRFAPSQRWSAIFPALSVGWRLSDENFIKNLNVFDNLKLRASWGQAGNQEINAFGYYDYIQLINIGGAYPFGVNDAPTPSAILSGIAAPDRTWETIVNRNIGVDIGVLKNHLNLSFDLYQKENKDMLLAVTVPSVLGALPPTTNSGSLLTKGWEISVNWKDNIGKFNYRISANLYNNTNILTNLGGKDAYAPGLVYARQGYPINSYFGYVSNGIIKTQAQLDAYKQLKGVPNDIAIGDVMYKDVDGDGEITAYGDPSKGSKGDLVYLGNESPRLNFGFNISINYKRFDFATFFQGIGKQQVIRQGTFSMPFSQPYWQPMQYFYGKTWSPENPNAKYGRLTHNASENNWNYQPSSLQVVQAAYLSCKNIQIGYTFSSEVIRKIKVQSARIFLSGEDLFDISNATWGGSINPEDPNGTNTTTYPFFRAYSLGLTVTF